VSQNLLQEEAFAHKLKVIVIFVSHRRIIEIVVEAIVPIVERVHGEGLPL